jgi:hypothetical protein
MFEPLKRILRTRIANFCALASGSKIVPAANKIEILSAGLLKRQPESTKLK